MTNNPKQSRLADYLQAMKRGGPGWREAHENRECPSGHVYRLMGHYEGMLEELIDLIGIDRVLALVEAHDAVRRRIEEVGPGSKRC